MADASTDPDAGADPASDLPAGPPPDGVFDPEATTNWDIDEQSALVDTRFTYPGNRSFFNGVNELSNGELEGYVGKRGELAVMRRARNLRAHRVRALRTEVAGIGAAETTVRSAVSALEADAADATRRIADTKAEREVKRARIAEVRERVNRKVEGLSLPITLLFLAGAVLFSAADYGIAREVANKVFNYARAESIVFAVSIACMPLVLKPAVERFVEKPYQAGALQGAPKFSRGFYWVVFGVMFAYLGLFGYVRHAQSLAIQEFNVEKRAYDVAAENAALRGLSYEVAPPRQRSADAASLVLFNTASGALAGLAGAICLVMAFGPMPAYAHKFRCWLQVARKRDAARETKRLQRLFKELLETNKELYARRQRLALFDKLREAEDALLAAQADEFRVAGELVTLYTRDEYQRGTAYELDAQLRATINRLEGSDEDLEHAASGGGRARAPRAGTRGRAREADGNPLDGYLHQQLRQHIMRAGPKSA